LENQRRVLENGRRRCSEGFNMRLERTTAARGRRAEKRKLSREWRDKGEGV